MKHDARIKEKTLSCRHILNEIYTYFAQKKYIMNYMAWDVLYFLPIRSWGRV